MADKEQLEAALAFYNRSYDVLGSWLVHPGEIHTLGDKENRKCRFCGRTPPDATFKMVAHAIPEALGNKSLFTTYECDECNQAFGGGIEDHFGKWSKPMRTFAQIRGKSGIPTLKKGSQGGWRIEFNETGMHVTEYETDPITEMDEIAKRITFRLKREPHVPIAVLKAFVKMGLSLMPENEMVNFKGALWWVRERDHTKDFVSQLPVFYTFVPGPRPFDGIAAYLVRRKDDSLKIPYASFILAYGNEAYQIFLPSPERDAAINGLTLPLYPFLTPYDLQPSDYGALKRGSLNLMGRELIKGDVFVISLNMDEVRRVDVAKES